MSDKKKTGRRHFLRTVPLIAASTMLGKGLLSAATVETDSCDATTLDYYGEGPFYTPNPPQIQNGQLAPPNEPGTRMIITGRVYNLDCTQVLPGTVVDIWHADDSGQYDNVSFNLRGYTTANAQGFYSFETVKPGKYLNGNTYRPSHIHFKISPPSHPTLTTQLYFQGDSDIPGDAAASITSGTYNASHRIIPLTMNNGVYEGTWDIVVNGSGVTGVPDMHLNTGMIYSVHPNPFRDRLEIRYGVFHPAKVSLSIFDMQGRLVADIESLELDAARYTAIWEVPANLSAGAYFAVLKVNDLQVHYQKILKQ